MASNRHIKRALRAVKYARANLNGARAVARRRRQILAGQLTESNGLVR